MPAANIIRLRALLSEKFPGVRMRLDGSRTAENRFWPTGLPQIDSPLQGGLPRGALSEIVAAGKNNGSATLIRALLDRAARENQPVALIDGNDSLEVTTLGEPVLSRLLWVRCRTAATALKAADLVLRDHNLPLVLLDLKLNPEKQLRKIPATTWYRFQRLIQETSTVGIVFTPRTLVGPAAARLILGPSFSFPTLEGGATDCLPQLKLEIAEAIPARGPVHHSFTG